MRYTDGSDSSTPRPSAEGPLAALQGTPYAQRFCAWRGESGQRYVASVVAADALGGEWDAAPCVLIAVGRDARGRRVVDVTAIERQGDWRAARARGWASGAVEWHIHLLAADRTTRAAIVADLRERHCAEVVQALCA